MRNKTFVRVVAAVLLIALVLSMGVAAMAQESPESPVGEIIPQPNSGEPPKEAGDRGGSLQLGLLALIGVSITGMAVHVSKRAKVAGERRLERARAQAPPR